MESVYIKNMVCNRCVLAVEQVFQTLNIPVSQVALGEVKLTTGLTDAQRSALDAALLPLGFERMDDRKARLIESIKSTVIRIVHQDGELDLRSNWSTILSEALHHEYAWLSNLFSSVEGTTLEHYIIAQKIERVKELLFYDELTLSQIASKLGYSSVAHLSAQFKKVTGLTPSEMKKSRALEETRKPLDQVR